MRYHFRDGEVDIVGVTQAYCNATISCKSTMNLQCKTCESVSDTKNNRRNSDWVWVWVQEHIIKLSVGTINLAIKLNNSRHKQRTNLIETPLP